MTATPQHIGSADRAAVSRRRRRRSSAASSLWQQQDNDEMTHEDIFDGPGLGESVPTSTSFYAHKSLRRDSLSSNASLSDNNEARRQSLHGSMAHGMDELDDFGGSVLGTPGPHDDDVDDAISLASEVTSVGAASESDLLDSPLLTGESDTDGGILLHRSHSADSTRSVRGGARSAQRIYLEEEDMFIVVTGYKSDRTRVILVHIFGLLTLGMGFLLLRWSPRWLVRLTGKRESLDECDWVTIENQWGELSLHKIGLAKYERYLSTVFPAAELLRYSPDPEVNDPFVEKLRYVDYRYSRFIYHPVGKRLLQNNNWKDPEWAKRVKDIKNGLDDETHIDRLTLFGKNVVDIEEKSFPKLLIDEALHPFYIFQIMSIILWSCDEYYYYAACIFVISLVSVLSTLVETKRTMRRLREISRFVCQVRVLRSGFWSFVNSDDLVPGDVFEISDPSLTIFPCDALLISGDAVVNESMLTGESIPVNKSSANDKVLRLLNVAKVNISPELAKHYLFSGTKIIQTRKPSSRDSEDAAAIAVVTRTGFNTTKGALVRSMLFPRPIGFKFYRDSFRFIGVMTLVAICGFVYSTINFVRLGVGSDLITIVVPPALPATLTIGTNFAISRLKKQNIFCISPQRVNIGGKIDLMAFDKTGTLTEDGLDILGIVPVESDTSSLSDIEYGFNGLLQKAIANDRVCLDIILAMATCHSLRMVDNEVVGDPLDEKMFKFTGWTYHDDDVTDTVRIVRPRARKHPNACPEYVTFKRTFEFVSQLRRMAVVINGGDKSNYDVYVKGAPEIMTQVCRPDSIPKDFTDTVMSYTHGGFRVIACARKKISRKTRVARLKRDEVESNLEFMGLFVFENKLKPATTGVLRELNSADIRTVMCSGDNILTAICVGRECAMIEQGSRVFVPSFETLETDNGVKKFVRWEDVDDPTHILDSRTLVEVPEREGRSEQANHKYCLAITGDVFRYLIDYAPLETLYKALYLGVIYARMSPDEKHELVERLQGLDYTVGFCGDGANDCGALTAADVGVSLSEAEASVAAPFTSRRFDISCVLNIIRDGRAALVTSFSCFQYMALYSAIQFTTVSILYTFGSNLGDFQFLFIDLFLILPIAVFMGQSGPYERLSKKKPTSNLISKDVIGSLLGQIVLIVLFQIFIWYLTTLQSWAIRPHPGRSESDIVNSDNTVLFIFSCFQYILIAVILNVGPPFRQPMYLNLPFLLSIATALLFVLYLLFMPSEWFSNVLQLTLLASGFKYIVVACTCVYFTTSWLGNKMIFKVLVNALGNVLSLFKFKQTKSLKKHEFVKHELLGSYSEA